MRIGIAILLLAAPVPQAYAQPTVISIGVPTSPELYVSCRPTQRQQVTSSLNGRSYTPSRCQRRIRGVIGIESGAATGVCRDLLIAEYAEAKANANEPVSELSPQQILGFNEACRELVQEAQGGLFVPPSGAATVGWGTQGH